MIRAGLLRIPTRGFVHGLGKRWCRDAVEGGLAGKQGTLKEFLEDELAQDSDARACEPPDAEGMHFKRKQVGDKYARKLDKMVRPSDILQKPLRLQEGETRMTRLTNEGLKRSVQKFGVKGRRIRSAMRNRRIQRMNFNTKLEEVAIPNYDDLEASINTVVDGPFTYAATSRVLFELMNLRSKFKPETVLDFGAGAGMATLATAATYSRGRWERTPEVTEINDEEILKLINRRLYGWGRKLCVKDVTLIERSNYLARIGRGILDTAFLRVDRKTSKPSHPVAMKWVRGFRDVGTDERFDLVLASKAFQELGGGIKTLHAAVKALWAVTKGYLVIVETGDMDGFARIQRVRDFFTRDFRDHFAIPGGRVVMPCVHSGMCPMEGKKLTCSFHQRFVIPPFKRYAESSRSSSGRAFYSYVVIEAEEEANRYSPAAWKLPYARVLHAPLKKRNHVLVDVCSRNGLERISVAPKAGRGTYRLARKTMKGDWWPLNPRTLNQEIEHAEYRVRVNTRLRHVSNKRYILYRSGLRKLEKLRGSAPMAESSDSAAQQEAEGSD